VVRSSLTYLIDSQPRRRPVPKLSVAVLTCRIDFLLPQNVDVIIFLLFVSPSLSPFPCPFPSFALQFRSCDRAHASVVPDRSTRMASLTQRTKYSAFCRHCPFWPHRHTESLNGHPSNGDKRRLCRWAKRQMAHGNELLFGCYVRMG